VFDPSVLFLDEHEGARGNVNATVSCDGIRRHPIKEGWQSPPCVPNTVVLQRVLEIGSTFRRIAIARRWRERGQDSW
jgi:hypothetical protein